MEIKKFGVIGAGQMGNGIAQVAAASGFEVLMSEIKEEFTANIVKIVHPGKYLPKWGFLIYIFYSIKVLNEII